MPSKYELMKFNSDDLSLLLHSSEGSVLEMPFGRLLFLASVRLNGIQYTNDIDTILAELEVGDILTLVREPDNVRDSNAISVHDRFGNHVGWVPRSSNEVLAHLLDAGKSIFAVLSRLSYNAEIFEKALNNTYTVKEQDDPDNFDYWPWNMMQMHIFMED